MKHRRMAHPMTFEERWNLDPEPAGRLAYWAVAMAGGLVAVLVVAAVIILFG